MKKGIIIAFGELFLKSKGVRKLFKNRLENNLCFFFKKKRIDFKIHSFRPRIFIETQETDKTLKLTSRVFGIEWASSGFFFKKSNLKEVANFWDKNWRDWIEKEETFAIRIKREKTIKESSREIIDRIAKNVKRKVDLDHPDKKIFIEARKKGWFLYFKKERGMGGLPVGASGKAISLVSGGIDSPVSSLMTAKRGVENVWVHFHSFPLVSKASIKKVKELVEVFLKYQPKLKVYFIPFQEIQKKIKVESAAKYRVLLYRRGMLKIAETIANKEKCKALITGESLGQVSSQTLNNLNITNRMVDIPILRPLIGLDKKEIINLAKSFETYKISIKPQEDCCTLFVSSGQTAKGSLKEIRLIEDKLNIEDLIEEAVENSETEQF